MTRLQYLPPQAARRDKDIAPLIRQWEADNGIRAEAGEHVSSIEVLWINNRLKARGSNKRIEVQADAATTQKNAYRVKGDANVIADNKSFDSGGMVVEGDKNRVSDNRVINSRGPNTQSHGDEVYLTPEQERVVREVLAPYTYQPVLIEYFRPSAASAATAARFEKMLAGCKWRVEVRGYDRWNNPADQFSINANDKARVPDAARALVDQLRAFHIPVSPGHLGHPNAKDALTIKVHIGATPSTNVVEADYPAFYVEKGSGLEIHGNTIMGGGPAIETESLSHGSVTGNVVVPLPIVADQARYAQMFIAYERANRSWWYILPEAERTTKVKDFDSAARVLVDAAKNNKATPEMFRAIIDIR